MFRDFPTYAGSHLRPGSLPLTHCSIQGLQERAAAAAAAGLGQATYLPPAQIHLYLLRPFAAAGVVAAGQHGAADSVVAVAIAVGLLAAVAAAQTGAAGGTGCGRVEVQGICCHRLRVTGPGGTVHPVLQAEQIQAHRTCMGQSMELYW